MRLFVICACWIHVAAYTQWFEPPQNGQDRDSWLDDLRHQRLDALTGSMTGVTYNGGLYDEFPTLRWTQTSYIQPQMHPYDRYFYNYTLHKYTVDRYLDDLEERYGGIDSLLMWPTYPHLGIDDRNQFDMFRYMPGGIEGVKAVTAQLHQRGVRVLWPYNPWDDGTRRDPLNRSDAQVMVELLHETNGDGFNGDTMDHFNKSFWDVAVQSKWPYAMQPEMEGTDDSLGWSTMGWAEGTPYEDPPVVDRYKFLDSRFLLNVCDRWNLNKGKQPMLTGYFNGGGVETWENVWSCWIGLTEGDGEAIRRAATILRFFGKEGFLQSPRWEPHVPTNTDEVYASVFPSPDGRETVWLVVNPDQNPHQVVNMTLTTPSGTTLYDCYRGTELDVVHTHPVAKGVAHPGWTAYPGLNCYNDHGAYELQQMGGEVALDECQGLCDDTYLCEGVVFQPNAHGRTGQCFQRANIHADQCDKSGEYTTYVKWARTAPGARATVRFDVEAEGIGCLVAVQDATAKSKPFRKFMNRMANMTSRKPLKCLDWDPVLLPQRLVPIAVTKLTKKAPKGMVTLPATHTYTFQTNGQEIETTRGCDFQFPWELQPDVQHSHILPVQSFHIDKYPVTIRDYEAYLNATKYTPRDPTRWLDNWDWPDGARRPTAPSGKAKVPVTYVTLDEARAYCSHHGKRLPNVWEWQYAAEANHHCVGNGTCGTQSIPYPWGSQDPSTGNFMPDTVQANTLPGADAVDAHPDGCSAYGVCDMVGNVWQYTNEFQDDRSRMVLVKGGSNYIPSGFATWYFPQCQQVQQHNRFTMMDDSYDRAGTFGFRCVVDKEPLPPTPKPKPTPLPGKPCAGGANLCGELIGNSTANPLPSTDLSRVGSTDWIHYGTQGAQPYLQDIDRKASASNVSQPAGVIKDLTLLKNTTVNWFGNSLQTLTWDDAVTEHDPECAGHDTKAGAGSATTGVWIQDIGNGFVTAVEAKSTYQTLVAYVGLCCGTGHFTATLQPADPSLTDYMQSTEKYEVRLNHPDPESNDQEGVIAITFKSPDAGVAGGKGRWILRVTWVHEEEEGGNVTFQAICLRDTKSQEEQQQ